MTKLRCSVCGKPHDLDESEVGYQLPDEYYALSADERARRGRADSDLCELDDRYFIRGVLIVPIRGEKRDFGWGVWAEVDRPTFRRYLQLYHTSAESREPPFAGRLANALPGYAPTLGLPVSIALTDPDTRPTFVLTGSDHPLAMDQREGMSLERVYEIMAPFWH